MASHICCSTGVVSLSHKHDSVTLHSSACPGVSQYSTLVSDSATFRVRGSALLFFLPIDPIQLILFACQMKIKAFLSAEMLTRLIKLGIVSLSISSVQMENGDNEMLLPAIPTHLNLGSNNFSKVF